MTPGAGPPTTTTTQPGVTNSSRADRRVSRSVQWTPLLIGLFNIAAGSCQVWRNGMNGAFPTSLRSWWMQ
jgi:hypothetical protein